MENQADSKNIIINYGLITAGASILLGLATYAMGSHLDPHWGSKALGFIIFIAFIVLGIKKYKQTNNGFLAWGQAVKVGVGIAIISALIGSIYQYIFMTFIEPNFMEQMMEIQYEKYLDLGMSDEEIEASQEMSKKFTGPLMMTAFGIIGSAIGGFIVAAIAGAIMKKTEEDQY